MKRISISLALVTALLSLNGQIKVATNNSVGIGESAPVSKFAVSAPGNSYATAYIENINATNSSRGLQVRNSIATSSWGYAILATTPFTASSAIKNVGAKGQAYSSNAVASRRSYGVWGMAGNATPGWNYGVYGELGGSNNGAAIFATVPGKGDCYVGGKYAGYFRGNVYIENDLTVIGTYNPSDINLKKDIRPLKNDHASQIDAIKTLSAIRFKYKTPLELNLISNAVLDTSSVNYELEFAKDEKYTQDWIGLSAQEVQAVFPELVKENEDGYINVNYTGLIPVLVEVIKEQDESININEKQLTDQSKELANQAEEIAELRKLVEGLLSTEKE